MNTIVEHINSAGFSFVEFALPMLVQSGVLIVILLLADLLLRKKVKAVFRYWIWMLVLVKLVLPTSLSSPLSLGYLFGDKLTYQDLAQTSPILEPTEPAPADISPGIDPLFIQPNPYIPPTAPVTSVFEPMIAEPVSPPQVPVTPLSWQGVVFLVWLAVAIAMGLLLLQRALFVRGLVAQSKKAGRLMNDALAYCCASMGIKSKVGLKISVNATTPSVCGLVRPVILVPWNLTSTLGASRLRTVLMHELVHIKRTDLWVNLAQTVLQIIYFYNPLLWLANCVIRRIREQAVDEAVLVAMGEKAQKYPQTLVDVAKMAFKRPALSLRLIGVVESKSALAGRIKHILGRPMPKTARLGIVGVLAVIIAGAILLPMAAGKDDQGASEDIAKASEFMATLPNDVTVELVGLTRHYVQSERPAKQTWWGPSGEILEKMPYAKLGLSATTDYRNSNYEFAIRLDAEEENTYAAETSLSRSRRFPNIPKTKNDESLPNIRAFIGEFRKEDKEGNIRFGVAAGPWQEVEVWRDGWTGGEAYNVITHSKSSVVYEWPRQDGNKVVIEVTHTLANEDRRLLIVDKDGKIHIGGGRKFMGEGAGIVRDIYYFRNFNRKDMEVLKFEKRPYEWVEFKSVSLRPGMKTDVQVEVEYNNSLYQKQGSIRYALEFIGMPEELIDTTFVSKHGQLASPRQLEFANKLFRIRKSKDVDAFISLLSDGTKKQLNDGNNRRMLHNHIKGVKEGTFLRGQYDFKFFATFREFTDKDWDKLKEHVSFAEPPTHAIVYYHFHKGMCLGSTFYLIEDNGSYKLVPETLLSEPVIPVKKEQPTGPKEYGIVSFNQTDDAYTKPGVGKYHWNIELSPEVSENNTFQILKTTKVVSGQADLHPEIAAQKIIDESMIEKYKYDTLKCRFYVGASEPGYNYHKYGRKLSGWLCGLSIANTSKSTSMLFPGKDVTNVKPNKQGNFIGSDLELLSFETSEGNIRYEHKVILRKDDSPEAKSAALLRLEQMTRRRISNKKLQYLDRILTTYANDHNSEYPDRLVQIKPYDTDEWLDWLLENVEYLGKGKTLTETSKTVIAYDKTLLEKAGSTNVLFNEGPVQYCNPNWLKKLGITGNQKPDVQIEVEKPALNSRLIVPGQGVGDYKFGMSKDDVLKSLRKTKGDSLREAGNSISVDGVILNIIDDSVNSIDVLSPFYKFANGLGIGSSEQQIIQAFGNDFYLKEYEGKDFLTYKDKGLVFEIYKYKRTVMEISVLKIDDSLNPSRKPDVPVEVEKTSQSQFSTTLPNGVTVELAGILEFSDGKVQSCWKPDGIPFDEPIHVKYGPKYDHKVFGFVFNTDIPSEIIKYDIKGTMDRLGSAAVVDANDRLTQLTQQKKQHIKLLKLAESDTTQISLSIAPEWKSSTQYDGKYIIGRKNPKIKFLETYESGDSLKVVFSHEYEGYDFRLQAYLTQDATERLRNTPGRTYLYRRNGKLSIVYTPEGMKRTSALFEGLKLSDIKYFTLYIRPKSNQVKFSNVPLRPVDKPDVQVEVEGDGAVSGESEVKPAASQDGPRITFESLVCDLGHVAPNTKNLCEFKYTNTGSDVLKITRVGAACACTVPQKTRECAPGKSETLKVTYRASGRAGQVKKNVYVFSNDKVNPKVKLTIKAEIVVKVAHEPKKLNLVLDKENAGCPVITLSSLDNQPFSITGFKSTGDSITADFEPSVKDTSFVIQPKADMQKLRKGLRGQVEISLTHPECKKVTIVFDTLAEFKVDPRVVYIRDAEPRKAVTKKVFIFSNYDEDVEVQSTSSKKGTVRVLTQEKVRNGCQLELEITPPAAPQTKRRVFIDVFTVVLKGGQQLQITCYGIYSKKAKSPTEESVSKTDVQIKVEQSSSESGGDRVVVVSEGKSTVYSSLKEAVAAAPAGSVIRVEAGVYGDVPGPVKTRGGISGVVINSDTGDPIVGAYVGVGDFGDSSGSNYSRHRSQGFHDKTKTDAEGRFELGGLVFTDKHRYLKYHPLVVTHPDFVRHDRKIELPSDGPAPDVKVNLMPAAKIDVTIVDTEGNPLPGQWLIRLEALDGRRFIPPGSDPHLSSFASSIWAHMPDLRSKMGVSNGFTFTELDAGEYSIEAIRFHLVDKPTPQNIWKPTITYHGSIPNIRIQTGQAQQVQLTPQDHQTRLTITPPDFPDKLMDKLERSSQMPLMCLISRSPGLLLWGDGKIYHLEDQRLGRISKRHFFRGFFLQGKPLTINNLPPDSYSLFAMAVYGQVAGCLIGARAELAKGDKMTLDIPWRQPTGPSRVGPSSAFDYPVKLEAKDYSASELCEILTEITQSNPRIIADPSIENEKLSFGKGEMSVWDVLEKLYLDKGWRVGEGKEKTLIIRPAEV